MREVRRISRALSVLIRTMFGHLECSAIEWHTLDLLARPGASSHVVDIADLLGAPTKTFAALIQRLETRGIIKQSINAQDNRYRTITLTPASKALYRKHRVAAETLLGDALIKLPASERRILTKLFSLYTGTNLPAEGTVVASSLLLRRISDDKLLWEARAFTYRAGVKQNLVDSESTDLLGERSVNYEAWMNDTLVAVSSFISSNRQGT
jgi:DNA-binding MarR family transcriptional regulator